MEGSGMKKLTVSLLQLNGWVAVLIGSFIVIDPVSMLSNYGLPSDLSTGLMSELRAPGGLLIASGLLIIRYSLNSRLYDQGLLISVLVYGSYGSVRLISMLADGIPPMEILTATAIELLLFGLSLIAILKPGAIRWPETA